MMWLPNPLSLYHKEGFLVSKDFYSTASSGGLFALKLTNKTALYRAVNIFSYSSSSSSSHSEAQGGKLGGTIDIKYAIKSFNDASE